MGLPDGYRKRLFDHLERMAIRPQSPEIFIKAFTHASYANEQLNQRLEANERLEFLGDAVIELSVSEHLYRRFPDLPEGRLTRIRAAIVQTKSLAAKAEALDLHRFLLLGRGESAESGEQRESTLADLFEAVVGAAFIDAGWDEARRFVLEKLEGEIADVSSGMTAKDHRTMLQEWMQKTAGQLPRYEILGSSGPDHARRFRAAVYDGETMIGRGEGSSKKKAMQNAAGAAVRALGLVDETEG